MGRNVRYWHKADITLTVRNVRFWGKADIAGIFKVFRMSD